MLVSIIIPYKEDRGWLQQAIDSVPKDKDIELILSKGDGNWPQNFNKALPKAKGKYIKYLHEDDMLYPNSIDWCVKFFEAYPKSIDFIHGNAIEIHEMNKKSIVWKTTNKTPTFNSLLHKNTIHSATLIYKREIFEKLGGFNESPKMYSFEEYEFNLRCLQYRYNIGHIDANLAYYRRHPKQIIRTVDKKERIKNRLEMLNSFK